MPFFETSDKLRVHYTDEGAGVPILCLPGLTRTTADFDYVTPHLTDVRLIKLDYRGRGKSEWDKNWRNYNLVRESQDVIELLDHLGLEKVAVLGTSRGGLLAMGLALGAKDRLAGVALNDIGPVIEPEGLNYIMGYLGRRPGAKTDPAGLNDFAFIAERLELSDHHRFEAKGRCGDEIELGHDGDATSRPLRTRA